MLSKHAACCSWAAHFVKRLGITVKRLGIAKTTGICTQTTGNYGQTTGNYGFGKGHFLHDWELRSLCWELRSLCWELRSFYVQKVTCFICCFQHVLILFFALCADIMPDVTATEAASIQTACCKGAHASSLSLWCPCVLSLATCAGPKLCSGYHRVSKTTQCGHIVNIYIYICPCCGDRWLSKHCNIYICIFILGWDLSHATAHETS